MSTYQLCAKQMLLKTMDTKFPDSGGQAKYKQV